MSKIYFGGTIDEKTGAIYVYINSEATVESTVEVNSKVNVDLDADGNPIGLEWI